MGMSVGSILLVVVAVAFFCWFFLQRLCVDTTPRNLHVYQALASPSVRGAASALDRRIALAVREAQNGLRVCEVCEFANTTRMRVASCVLCGAPLRPRERYGLAKLMPQKEAPPTSDELLRCTPSRQRRVRRRKEWIRQRHAADNSVVWYHDPQHQDPSSTGFKHYVLRTNLTKDTNLSLPEDTPPDEINVVVNPSPKPSIMLADVGDKLYTLLQSTTVNVVDAEASDPTHVAFASATINVSAPATGLDYPAKLVQFMTSVATFLVEKNDGETPSVAHFHIARGEVWTDSVEVIATMDAEQARLPIRVDFVGEPGIDAGALYREWMGLLNKSLINPETGIFTCVDPHEQTFYLNSQSQDVLGDAHLAHFLVAGRLIGRALLDGNVTGFQLAPPLLKIMLGLPVSFSDLEYYDAEAYKSLQWLITNEGVDMLGLDFTVVEKLPDGTTRIIELVPGGSEIDVTDANKMEYIDRKLQYLLFESVQSQLFAFLTGLYEVVPPELLVMFDAEELGLLLSGSDEIDVDDWEANTVAYLDDGLPERKQLSLLPCYQNFWKIVRAMTNDERRRLLHFATGSTRPPPGGFSSLTSYDGRLALFTLRGVTQETTHGHLQSHACFNRVDLPTFWGMTNLRKAVYAAIAFEEDGFTIQ